LIVARGLGRLGTPIATGGLGLRGAVVVARIRVGGIWPPQRQQWLERQPERELPRVRDIILLRQDDDDILLILATLIADDQLE
jgi:hypothetical protein